MSLGLRADPTNTSAVISVAGTDQVVITNASNVVATTFTGALVGTAANATGLVNSPGVAPVYGVRAFVSFDGARNTSNVVSYTNTDRYIRSSGNITNVLRNGQGDYTVNFATAMPDANYCCSGICRGFDASNNSMEYIGISTDFTPTASAIRIVVTHPGSFYDVDIVNLMVVR